MSKKYDKYSDYNTDKTNDRIYGRKSNLSQVALSALPLGLEPRTL